jgi:DNA-binding Lrp family transcriptional regulator
VVASFVVTGEANYMLRVRARTLKDYSDFVMNRLYKVPGVLDIRSHMVLRNLGESNVLGAGLMQAGA